MAEHYGISWDKSPELGLRNFYPGAQQITGDLLIDAGKLFRIDGLVDEIKLSSNQFWLKADLFNELGLDTHLLQSADFQEVEEWKVGRTKSKSKVFFGKLSLTVDDPVRTALELDVACKPFHGWVSGAVHEYASYEHVNQEGFIETFHPIGFWVDGNSKVFLLSHFENDVVTLDNVDWQHNTDDPLRQHLNIFTALERAAYSLGRFHSRGYALNDALAQNLAADSHGIRAVDLEQLRLIHTSESPDIEAMRAHMFKDARDFIGSVLVQGFLYGDSPENKLRVLQTGFLQPYTSTMRHPSTMFSGFGKQAQQAAEGVIADLSDILRS